MLIISVSPSSPVLGFCVTWVAGRIEEAEKYAQGWRKRDGVSDDFGYLQREVPAATAAVARRGANSPEDAERRKAGREVERSRRGRCDKRRTAVDVTEGLDIFLRSAESQGRKYGKRES